MAYYARYEPDETGALQKVVYNCGIGFCLPFYGETAPPGTLACDGSEISREAYSELFAVLGTKAGAGDGATTFNLPDLRGRFIRGTGGSAAELGVEQGDAIREMTGHLDRIVRSENSTNASTGVFQADSSPVVSTVYELGSYGEYNGINFIASNVVPTANEVRPVNVALLWCIIYE